MAEKKCKYCAMRIPRKAKICPYCRKKQGTTLLTVIAAFFLVMLFFAFIRQTDHKPSQQEQDQNPSSRSSSPRKEEQGTVNVTPNLPDIHIQASDFVNAGSDPSGKKQYEGRTLVITGTISGIFIPPASVVMRMAEKGLSAQPFIYFSDKPVSDVRETLMGNGVSCYFLDESLVAKASQMHRGQSITLRCKCIGLHTLEDCTLANEERPTLNEAPTPLTSTIKPDSSAEQVEELSLTGEELKRYSESYRTIEVLQLRRFLNTYADSRDNVNTSEEGTAKSLDALAIDKNIIRSKFMLYWWEDSIGGGKQITIVSQEHPEVILTFWVYKLADKITCEVRALFNKPDDRNLALFKKKYAKFLNDKELAM